MRIKLASVFAVLLLAFAGNLANVNADVIDIDNSDRAEMNILDYKSQGGNVEMFDAADCIRANDNFDQTFCLNQDNAKQNPSDNPDTDRNPIDRVDDNLGSDNPDSYEQIDYFDDKLNDVYDLPSDWRA